MNLKFFIQLSKVLLVEIVLITYVNIRKQLTSSLEISNISFILKETSEMWKNVNNLCNFLISLDSPLYAMYNITTISWAKLKKLHSINMQEGDPRNFTKTNRLRPCLDEESFEWYHPIFITHDPKLVGPTEEHLFGLHDSWSVTQFPSLNSLIFELWVMETENTF